MRNRYIKFIGKIQGSKDECSIVQLSRRVKEIKQQTQFQPTGSYLGAKGSIRPIKKGLDCCLNLFSYW